MATTATRNVLDTIYARVIALILAGLTALLLFNNWGVEITAAMQGKPSSNAVAKAPVSEANPALDACLSRRVGHIETMKRDGVINDTQFASFKARAVTLCHAQNRGPV